ncbi:hypothetical protein AVEN_98040-1 [Araneus ventricosus]|uniref:Uncharacterized protein n=1 Tax=Araneus ventricosus TaxID=182803 RepID=A0A4Y2G6G3_ARAVE|nr:hypothetical protein AVEN_98040-1 [Araneus ventricosus]
MQQALKDDGLAGTLIFSDEATSHLSGKVNRHNVRVWGTESTSLEHNCPRLSQQRTAASLDRASWSGSCSTFAMVPQVARCPAM